VIDVYVVRCTRLILFLAKYLQVTFHVAHCTEDKLFCISKTVLLGEHCI